MKKGSFPFLYFLYMYGKEESVIKEKKVGSPVKNAKIHAACSQSRMFSKKNVANPEYTFSEEGWIREGKKKRMRLIDQGQEKKRWKAAPKEEGEKERKKRTSFLLRRRGNNGCRGKDAKKKKRKGAVAIVVL